MTELMKSLPAAPYHFPIFVAIVWRLYYLLSWPSFAIATVSLLWLVIRLHRVLRQPVERLIEILGIEVPSAPLIELLEISSDTVSIHWHAAEKYANTKYAVCVNGFTVGEITSQETAISITGLAAGVYYTIRVIASTHGKYHAASDSIRVQTSQATCEEEEEEEEGSSASRRSSNTPAVVPYKGAYENLAIPISSSPLVREHSNSLSNPRRRESGKRGSPSSFAIQADKQGASANHSQETIQRLTVKLNELRKETDEQERQDDEEDRQYQAEMQTLTERRDRLKQELKEKEDSSKELRKTVAQLERQNQTAQVKRATQEKTLESKHSERRKLREDTERWDRERIQLQDSVESMNAEKEKLAQDLEEKLDKHRVDREPDVEAIRKLEEQIRDTGKQVKELEEIRKESSEPSDSPRVSEGEIKSSTTSRDHDDRTKELQEELNRKWLETRQAHEVFYSLKSRLQAAIAHRRASQANAYDPNAAEFTPSTPAFTGPPRELERRASLGAYGLNFPTSVALEGRNPFPTSLHTNVDSGLPPNDADADRWLKAFPTQADIDKLTGGALTSPAANALLPSGLLGDEGDSPSKRRKSHRSAHESDSLGSRPSSTLPPAGFEYHQALRETSDPLPGLGTLPGLGSTAALTSQNPQSPAAGDSRSPSLTSSPHDSMYPRPSETFDSDRRSIRSTSSSTRAFGTGRSRFLGDVFNRQRGKSSADEGPVLGSLRSSESQSFPRQSDQDDAGENPAFTGQRRAATGLFTSLGRRALGNNRLASSHDDISQNPLPGASRLGSRMFPWTHSSLDAGTSSRPTSVYSAENTFPRPSGDIQQPFGWNESGLGRSNTTASARNRMNPWSSGSSRRASTNIESSGISEFGQIDEDALPLSDRNNSPVQAPIGTKPKANAKKESKESKENASAKQLNPNARDFRSMFSRDKKSDKKKDKSPSRPGTRESTPDDLGISGTPQAQEPKTHSANGSTEDVLSTVSARASESGPSTPAEAATPTTRESLMKKLTRKGSHLPGLKGRKTAGAGTPQTNNEDTDEDAASGFGFSITRTPSSLTSSPKVSHERDKEKEKDSVTKRSSGFSIHSFKKRGRKDKDAPSISETSMTSGTGDDADAGGSERPSTDD